MKKALSIFLIAILIAAGNAVAIQIPYPLYGYIRDSNGNPVAGIEVRVREPMTGQTKTDVTDKLGRYTITLDSYRDGDEVQIIAGEVAASKIIDVQSGGAQVDLWIKAVMPAAGNSNWMTEETIIGLPNWALIITAILSSGIGLTARLLKTQRIKARDETIEHIKQNAQPNTILK